MTAQKRPSDPIKVQKLLEEHDAARAAYAEVATFGLAHDATWQQIKASDSAWKRLQAARNGLKDFAETHRP